MRRIISVILILVVYIEAQSPSLPCQTDYCNCDRTTSEISWECLPPSSIFPEPFAQRYYVGENVPADYLDVGIERSVGLKFLKETNTLEVDCANFVLTNTTVNADIFDYLPKLSVGSLSTLKFRFCPLPKESFQAFLLKLNVTQLKSLFFSHTQSSINTLSPPYFDNLSDVEFISFTDNANLTGLHADLLRNKPQLRNLNLRGNAIADIDSETFKNLPKLKILDLGNNKISDLHPDVFKQLGSLKGLNIDNNAIVNLTRDHFRSNPNLESLSISGNNISVLPSDVFVDLVKLQKLHANRNKFQTFPKDLFSGNKMLTEIKIAYHKKSLVELPGEMFANLPELTTVIFQESGIESLPTDLFWNSPKLTTLSLTGHRKLLIVPRDLFRDSARLIKLDLSGNKLKTIPEETFESLRTLKKVDLRNNQIEEITNGMFIGLKALEDLDISHNKLKVVASEAFDDLASLTTVDLSHNHLNFAQNVTYSPLKLCTNLKEINLSYNELDAIFNDWYISMTTLEMLDLKRNKLTYVPTELFYSIVPTQLTVDLSSNQISSVDLRYLEMYIRSQDESKSGYTSSRSEHKNRIILDANPLSCNCSNYDLIAFLGRSMSEEVYSRLDIETNDVQCEQVNIRDVKVDAVYCDVTDRCPQPCHCMYWPSSRLINVNCSSSLLSEMPRVLPNSFSGMNDLSIQLILSNNAIHQLPDDQPEVYDRVIELDLSNNKLTDVNNLWTELPNLKKLDLSHNSLSSLSQQFLNNVSSTLSPNSLSLFENPWECNCSIEALHSFVLNKHTFLNNSELITCVGESKPLNQMTNKDFCISLSDRLTPVLVCLGTLGFLFGILIGLYYRYEHEIKVWLFAHKLLLWLFKEDADSDKVFDAFVSFSNDDEEYVTRELIPELEKDFKVCFHMKHFLPGEWIHTQIEDFIHKSRRTICVLSENFLESNWAMHEFRTAHAQSIESNCNRVILLIYGDMPPQDKMDPDMKAYMKTHTYIKSNDDWFWHKLRYALPHATKPTDKIAMKSTSDFTVLIKPDFLEPSKIHAPEIMKKG